MTSKSKLIEDRQRYLALACHEPRLFALEHDVAGYAARHRSYSRRIEHWYSRFGFKQRLVKLVGFDRQGDPVLGTPRAYDAVYGWLLSLLEDPAARQVYNADMA